MAQTAVEALSLDSVLADRLSRGTMRGTVHSTFRHVVNVLSSEAELVALCASGLDDAPWSVRVDLADWDALGVADGMPVTFDADTVWLGQVSISLEHATLWQCRCAAATPHTGALTHRIGIVAAVLIEHGVRGGILSAGRMVDPFGSTLATILNASLRTIVQAECDGDGVALGGAIDRMLGLGRGLTPACDDVLTGITLVASRPASRIVLLPNVLASRLDAQPQCTTALSRATLREAIQGRARQRIMELLEALFGSDTTTDTKLAEATTGVLKIGHTSGTDTLAGVLASIRLEQRLERVRVRNCAA
ncbi:DUF2877 domain-containing protein [Rathayibacter soli]|uniref:DUF2877 domain-containing protein n=1 Tax=Rathayibacter soli TaxID=3144168 RepID=UPI0027E447CD|nr:DUF2877 domain-containing protein [Glaciibacter superstes]